MKMARARARNNYLQMHCPPFIIYMYYNVWKNREMSSTFIKVRNDQVGREDLLFGFLRQEKK